MLLRCFIGGAIQPETCEQDDATLIAVARQEMRDLLGITAEPLFALVHRHPQAMPQYPVGHLNHIAHISAMVRKHAGLALAGTAYGGVGIPACVRGGQAASDQLTFTRAKEE